MCLWTSEARCRRSHRAGAFFRGVLEGEQGQQDEYGQHADLQEYRGEYGGYPGASRLFHEGEPCGCRRYAQQRKAWHDQKEHGGVRTDDLDGEYVACPAYGLDGVKAPQGGVVALAQEKQGQVDAAAEHDEENDGGERGQGTHVGDDDAQAGEPVQKKREKIDDPFHGAGFCRVSYGRCAVSGGRDVVPFAGAAGWCTVMAAGGRSGVQSGTGGVVKCSHVVRAMAAIIFSARALGSLQR